MIHVSELPLPLRGNMPTSSKITCQKCEKVFSAEEFANLSNPQRADYKFCKACLRVKLVELRRNALEVLYGGPKIHKLTFDAFKSLPGKEKGLAVAREYSGENLFFWGPCGTGKSHLAAAIMNEWVKNCPVSKIRYETPATLNRRMRMLDPDEEQARLDDYINASLVVFDEVGFSQDTDFSKRIFYEILDGRDRREKRGMIITSNLFIDDLAHLYKDDRISSRIAGSFRVIQVTGEDMRGK